MSAPAFEDEHAEADARGRRDGKETGQRRLQHGDKFG